VRYRWRYRRGAIMAANRLPFKYLSSADLQEIFGVTRKTILRWIEKGKIPRPVKLGRRSMWRDCDIMKLCEALSSKAKKRK
jgi:predicted DNA-binding transcriptional regulator AlpA